MSRFDVLTMGNALVDVLAFADDDFVTRTGVEPGAMTMIDAARSDEIYAEMGPATEASGGSAANTAAGVASFGGKAAYIGRVADDAFGKVFAHDLRSLGVHFDTPLAIDGEPTGRCLVIVTPDAQRTLCTFLGAGAELDESYVDEALIASAAVTYLEGYIWDPPPAKDAVRRAAAIAHRADQRVALTLSDPFCVERHRDEFRELIEGHIDILFANEHEITMLYEVDTFDEALHHVRGHCEIAALTRGPHGSVIVAGDDVHVIDAHPADVVDTTGAGDVYAAGFLYGLTHGYDLATCGQLASLGAAEVISHLGPRPAVGLAESRDEFSAADRTVARLPRYRTGDPEIDQDIDELIAKVGDVNDADLVFELIVSAVRLARDRATRGDLKIANAALKEMRYSFAVFEPYRAARKAAIFGSARTRRDDPLYAQTVALARELADADWMVITGAGPGIMEAGIEGAGAANSFGVSIRLPFEAATTQFLADDPKLVSFRYFFTRKVTFVKEAHAFVLLPGGFGTLDEGFELLTLVQTGKAPPAPIVLLDVPGGTFWLSWVQFVERELRARGYISPEDLRLVKITDDPAVALAEITGFYRNYHSLRFVDGNLVLRMQHLPDAARIEALNTEFADILASGRIEPTTASKAETADDDFPDLARLRMRFDRRSYSRLRELIDRINEAG